MKHAYLLLFFCTFLVLISCKKSTPEKIIRPVKTMTIGANTLQGKTFPGYAEAEEYAYVNFRVGGMLQVLNADEGQDIKKGQLIASLDAKDYQLQVASTKAAYQQTASQLERYKNLYTRNAISKQEYEMTQALYENTQAAYNKASNDLQYTRLIAPFNGYVEKKYVENFQQVAAGERIIKLVNPNRLQFRFILPENNILLIKDSIQYSIAMDIDPEHFYQATVKEIVSASVGGSGIPVILKINDPSFDAKKMKVMPGYACFVKIKSTAVSNLDISIPLSCIYNDPDSKRSFVWKVDSQTSTVHLSPVQTGDMSAAQNIIILSGLQEGDIIVTAGVSMLAEGETVKIIQEAQHESR